MPLKYIGDLSKQDAQVLSEYAAKATRVLEFGVGGSTQIICQSVPASVGVFSVDTEPYWVEKTKGTIVQMGLTHKVTFVPYQNWRTNAVGQFDLIFDDGLSTERERFAEDAWPLLKVNGVMLFHDTRRGGESAIVSRVLQRHFMEISEVLPNVSDSNISVIRRTAPKVYVNWNIAEKREAWQYGHGEPPAEFFKS